ncbi:hypothetical protein BATDEDRAFT_13981 [Batrachochytrium dendrobatidis JAM81]|uniref:Cleft lip and palate transmembrane 1 n=1 Tax=Batrachochytrium dendrobatidis (strain JAM81 / FGSC 10211) TaxID=684364 RepID=F4PBG4_BATDJ|nr:uncharacterized protein BATDEDRAFT_13981 [Batrachochytrium dendrobatidis JAM81]EGF77440.1 hypothetical protein BATDEDRAFT_13981 [Batrachochytrium dendrobatidis JAM81]|eukprot:XP_006681860.1 hypothetical protein BATDEDRAFT_13981 [Batrachochytrium dendrobatidis JAM81]
MPNVQYTVLKLTKHFVKDLYFYISENERHSSSDLLVWKEVGIAFGNWSDIRQTELDISCSKSVQHNGTLYAHIYLTQSGISPDSQIARANPDGSLYIRKLLTRYMPKKADTIKKKLVARDSKSTQSSSTSADLDDESSTNHPNIDSGIAESSKPLPIISYWWPNVTINIVASDDDIPAANLRLAQDNFHFLPIYYVNDFWLLNDQIHPINDTIKTLHMSIRYAPIELWRFQLYQQFDESFRLQHEMMGVQTHETDVMKRMFIETNPVLLAVTMFVSILHSVFDFLAFKNDIDFWRKRKDMEGLSFRAIILNVVFQAIIFLYLLDNETSWMILASNGVGLLIEIWKINKTVIIKRKPEFPFVEFIDRVKPSKLTEKTRKFDQMAFGYLSYALFPLLVAYTIYSLVYEEHKSWYSFVVGTLVGFVYTFGFISMTPQLFINYKLKSVAHMPWKTFMYKALNTFVDDLFAFVIKMPWLHRLACLRDDVVFVVYLYQKWVYPEDKRRRNEFVCIFGCSLEIEYLSFTMLGSFYL